MQTSTGIVLDLLEATPALTVVVTSRQRTNLSIEALLPLAGLPLTDKSERSAAAGHAPSSAEGGDAATFFGFCAQRIRPGFAVDETNRAQIATLCRQLGGLPLAIELAAMQFDFYSLDELIATTAGDTDLLVAECSNRPGDHQRMDAMLDGMWQTLSADAQRLLAELSIFANAWHRDAMLAVAPAPRSVYKELVNGSLMQVEESGWFSLHPLVKQYAADRLPADSVATSRHAAHFLALLDLGERLLEPLQVQSAATLDLLRRRQHDLLQAWRWAVDNQRWDLVAGAIISFAHFVELAWQSSDGIALFKALVRKLQSAGDWQAAEQRLAGQAAFFTGVIGCRQSVATNEVEAKEWRALGIKWLEDAGTPYEMASACAYHGHLLAGSRINQQKGTTTLQRAVDLATQHGFPGIQTRVNCSLIQQLTSTGEWRKVAALDRETHALLPQIAAPGAPEFITFCQTSMLLDRWDEAEKRVNEYDAYFRGRPDYQKHLPWIVEFQCQILMHRGENQEAIAKLQANLQYKGTTACAYHSTSGYSLLAFWQAQYGDVAAALDSVRQALLLIQQTRHPNIIGPNLLRAAAAQILTGEPESARHLLLQALAIGLKLSNARITFTALYHLTTIHSADLPPELYRHILKVGAVCPAMYYLMRPLVEDRLRTAGISIDAKEAGRLGATDGEEIKDLVGEVAYYLPEIMPGDCSRSASDNKSVNAPSMPLSTTRVMGLAALQFSR